MSKYFQIITIAFIAIMSSSNVKAQLTPQEAIVEMIRGINIGNTMENGYNGPVQEYYFDDYKDAGYSCIRIPVKWGSHALEAPPYTIDESWFETVEQVIDWGLQRDLYLILNAHHEDWLKQNYTNAERRARFDSIWEQVANRFKDKSDKLLFEMINEPFGMSTAQISDLNLRVLSIIRQSNPTRIVIYGGKEWCSTGHLMEATIPEDDYIMGYFHSYDPWDFAGEANGTWGTQSDVNALQSMFAGIAQWSEQNNIPVMVSEFGAVKACDYNSRMRHYFTYVESSFKYNIAFQVWDDNGNFGIYNRDSRSWPVVGDILTKSHHDAPTNLATEQEGGSIIKLSWDNRSTTNTSIKIHRSADGENFDPIATIPANDDSYDDIGLSGGKTYYYRVVSVLGSGEELYSYPHQVKLISMNRLPFNGLAFSVPATIEAEDFDFGGEGLTYHDSEAENKLGAYRPSEGVDIEGRTDNGFHVGNIVAGEWLEYTVQVPKTANYVIKSFVSSVNGGAKFRYEVDDDISPTVTVPGTGDLLTFREVSTSFEIPEGRKELKFFVLSGSGFNVDRFEIAEDLASAVSEISELPNEFNLKQNYPNPFNPTTVIEYSIPRASEVTISIFDSIGKAVAVYQKGLQQSGNYEFEFNAKGLSSGAYIMQLQADNFVQSRKMILAK